MSPYPATHSSVDHPADLRGEGGASDARPNGPDDPDDPIDAATALAARRPRPVQPWADRLAEWRERIGVGEASIWSARRLLVAVGVVGLVVIVGWRLTARAPTVPVEKQLPRAVAPAAADGTSHAGGSSGQAGSSSAGGSVAGRSGTSVSGAGGTVVVHVAGAVAQPGLRTLSAPARVADALVAAGGPAPDADLDRLNLAAPVADGQRIYVLRRGEATEPLVAGGSGTAATGPTGASGGRAGPIDLNTATAEQLDTLPGVGPATAQAIIAYRQQHGGFHRVDDLLQVRGIGDARMEQLRPLVTVG